MSDKKLTLKEGIEKLKALLFSEEKPVNTEPIVTTEQKFIDEKLNDGTTIISYDAEQLETGVIVFILDEAGQRLPLPLGDYTTENGDTFSVVDDLGTIDNVVLAAEPEANPEEGDAVPAAPAPVETPMEAAPKRVIKSQVTEHVFSLDIEGYEPIEVDLSSMFKKLSDENVALKALNKEMFSVVEQLADMPVAAPTEAKKKTSISDEKLAFKASMKELETKMSKDNL